MASKMTAKERHEKTKEIFDQALLLDSTERLAYLRRASLGDDAVMHEVERLLASDLQTGSLWETAIQNQIADRLTVAFGASDHKDLIGEVLNGRYLIQSLLGEGGIGTVYRAADLRLHAKPVAVKLLREESYKAKDPKKEKWIKRKFLQEAEALSRVHHIGVVEVLDRDKLADGRPFFVMEWVDGRPLLDAITPYGLDFEQVAMLVRQMGEALTAVHEKHVFHRDLKPENIMLQSFGDEEERVKLIDFGIAKVKDSEFGPETSFALVVGTLPYLAPEQIQGQEISEMTDTYGLGVIAYEMLTGRRPFNPTSKELPVAMQQILQMQQTGQFIKPRELRRDLPEAAEQVIMKALSFHPKARYECAKSLGETLAQALIENKSAPQDKAQGVAQPAAELKPEPAHILFMDVIGYSAYPMSQQHQIVKQLQELVRNARTVKESREARQIIILFTGDGMALGFFGDPLVPMECAKEIAEAMQLQNDFELRLGLHTGPVYRIEDINANRNLSGSGVNFAQRVMDCGQAGQILLSKTYADYLLQLGGEWQRHLQDLGEREVKHKIKIHVFNFYNGKVGIPIEIAEERHEVLPNPQSQNSERRQESVTKWRLAGLALALLLAAIGGWLVWHFALSSGVTNRNALMDNRNISGGIIKPERTLNYTVVIQKIKNEKLVGEPIEMYGDLDSVIFFQADDAIHFRFRVLETGYLYLLNEAPQPWRDGKPIYYVLFPSKMDNDASALVEANQTRRIPRIDLQIPQQGWIGFGGGTGTEIIWLIWSSTPVVELEAVKRLNSPETGGKLTDIKQIVVIQDFLTEHSRTELKGEKDAANKLTRVNFTEDLLVHTIKLQHR
jgi:serine/threonine protein kinase